MKKQLLSVLVFGFLCYSGNITLAQSIMGKDFLQSAIDTSVNPGYDFFAYATGTWMRNNPIPASEQGWSIGNLVQEETYTRLKKLLEESMVANGAKGSSTQKIGDYYSVGMDTALIEKQGLEPIQEYLDKIERIRTGKDIIAVIAELQKIGVTAGFNLFVDQDAMNSDEWAMYLWQGGLGLPQRDYYFRNDARTQNIREEYKKHIAAMLALSGVDNNTAERHALSIFGMETFLADSSRKLEDLRDPYANYNKMEVKALQAKTPLLLWDNIFSITGAKKIDGLIVGQPEFFVQLNKAIANFSFIEWKAYLRWHLLNEFADKLPAAFANERFHFRGTIMSGVTEQRPRWKRMLDAVESGMGELLGQVYVQKYYSTATKKRYEKLVDDIILAYRERIQNLDWMSNETKAKAMVKLNAIIKKVGYPNTWKDFSKLDIDKSSFMGNYIKINIFWFNRNLERLGKPVDRTEWNMTPQTY
ncbi:MAG: M13 family metallopeptidase, partial [Ignavibacteriales bacterium]|nr:M13 family metallopeptidase [Ignavibacteriales bacterium]